MNTRLIMASHVRSYTPFIRGNIKAERFVTDDYVPIGQLPGFLADQLRAALTEHNVYVVYSYQTPIGWVRLNGTYEWFIPEITYSKSTTHHQGLLRVITEYPHMYTS